MGEPSCCNVYRKHGGRVTQWYWFESRRGKLALFSIIPSALSFVFHGTLRPTHGRSLQKLDVAVPQIGAEFRVGSCWVFIANIFVSPHQQTVLQSTTFRPGCPSHFQVSNRKKENANLFKSTGTLSRTIWKVHVWCVVASELWERHVR